MIEEYSDSLNLTILFGGGYHKVDSISLLAFSYASFGHASCDRGFFIAYRRFLLCIGDL